MPRLLHTGQVIVDLTMALDALPPAGGDVLARSASLQAGGGFNVMASAQRNGLQTLYLGRHGKGRFADMVREALSAEGIALALPLAPDKDTGICIALTEANAERTFISFIGAEGGLSANELAQVVVQPDDWVYVSGYSLLHPDKATCLLDWVSGLTPSVRVVFDPGPLIGSLEPALLGRLWPRVNLWSSNRREANSLPPAMALKHLPANCQIVVREGAQGCWIHHAQGQQCIPGFQVHALDTNGAGDAHMGILLAVLSAGHSLAYAAQRANAGAALAVTRWGPATAPRADEIDHFIEHARSYEP